MTQRNSKQDPRLLIDGYNLLFQSPLVGSGRSPGWLQRARDRLLQLLETKLSPADCRRTHIIFDASKNRQKTPTSFVAASGIVVRFAIDHTEADDLIEEIIRTHSHSKTLRVISSDLRIRRRATARKAVSIDSDTFLTELERAPDRPSPAAIPGPSIVGPEAATNAHPTTAVQPQPSHDDQLLSSAEVEHWLREFGQKP